MPSHAPYIHSGDPAYAPPLLRAPSPSSSIGTEYDQDETPFVEVHMDDKEFAKMCEDNLKLGRPRPQEEKANEDPLLARPRSQEDEQKMFINIMNNLRREVHLLEENNMFEQTILRGSQITEELQPTSDIDAIMRSLMGPPESPSPFPAPGGTFAPKPSFAPPNNAENETAMYQDFSIEPTSPIASTPAFSKSRLRGKGKTRRS